MHVEIPFKRILVTLDGSQVARAALPYAASLARAVGGTLIGLTLEGDSYEIDECDFGDGRERFDHKRFEHLNVLSDAAEEILRVAHERSIDLIVMGTHGRTGVARMLLGSVTEKVARDAPCPVLSVNMRGGRSDGGWLRRALQSERGFLQNILAPTDFSDLSAAGLRHAAELARAHGALLHVMHVVSESEFKHASDDLYSEEAKSAGYRLGELAARFAPLRIEPCVVVGSEVAAIARAARQRDIDLIVMATHGRKGLPRLLLGSVTEGVMRQAPCPVLTMQPDVVPAGLETQATHS